MNKSSMRKFFRTKLLLSLLVLTLAACSQHRPLPRDTTADIPKKPVSKSSDLMKELDADEEPSPAEESEALEPVPPPEVTEKPLVEPEETEPPQEQEVLEDATPFLEELLEEEEKQESVEEFVEDLPQGFPNILVDDMDLGSLKTAIARHLKVIRKSNLSKSYRLGSTTVTGQHLMETLEEFSQLLDRNLNPVDFSREVRKNFKVYSAGRENNPLSLFTGYYTPVIRASRHPTRKYRYPLYRLPDKVSRANYADRRSKSRADPAWIRKLTRKQIDGQKLLKNKKLEIAWLKDDVDRFFLHIQGSGLLKFSDGSAQGVQFMAANNYTYKGIGKLMIRDGAISGNQGSMQGIKKFLRKNPRLINKYFFQNKRYIFFKLIPHGPKGSSGVELVSGRSIATDKKIYPPGGLVFIQAKKPVLSSKNKVVSWQKFSRFVIDQDTGGDIKGPNRVDLYFGTGKRAGAAAGRYMQKGRVFYLVKK